MDSSTSDQTNPRILRLPQVCEITGIKRSMIYQLEAEHRFPSRIKIGARAVGWRQSDIFEWIASRPSANSSRP